MVQLADIRRAAVDAAKEYPVKRMELFGSYATGEADEDSDVDFLVEFIESPVSIARICGLREYLSERLKTDVDVVKLPYEENDGFKIGRRICLYGT